MTDALSFYRLAHAPFEDQTRGTVAIGTRPLRDTLARVHAELESGRGAVCVDGPPGIGKTYLLLALAGQLAQQAKVATLMRGDVAPRKLKEVLARSFGATDEKLSADVLGTLRQTSRLVAVVDGAERLPTETIFVVESLLRHTDASGRPYLECVLVAHLESVPSTSGLLGALSRLDATKLRFAPIPPEEVGDYIQRRLDRAGYCGQPLFTCDATLEVHRLAKGRPRGINRICSEALELGAGTRRDTIGVDLVAEARECLRRRAGDEVSSICGDSKAGGSSAGDSKSGSSKAGYSKTGKSGREHPGDSQSGQRTLGDSGRGHTANGHGGERQSRKAMPGADPRAHAGQSDPRDAKTTTASRLTTSVRDASHSHAPRAGVQDADGGPAVSMPADSGRGATSPGCGDASGTSMRGQTVRSPTTSERSTRAVIGAIPVTRGVPPSQAAPLTPKHDMAGARPASQTSPQTPEVDAEADVARRSPRTAAPPAARGAAVPEATPSSATEATMRPDVSADSPRANERREAMDAHAAGAAVASTSAGRLEETRARAPDTRSAERCADARAQIAAEPAERLAPARGDSERSSGGGRLGSIDTPAVSTPTAEAATAVAGSTPSAAAPVRSRSRSGALGMSLAAGAGMMAIVAAGTWVAVREPATPPDAAASRSAAADIERGAEPLDVTRLASPAVTPAVSTALAAESSGAAPTSPIARAQGEAERSEGKPRPTQTEPAIALDAATIAVTPKERAVPPPSTPPAPQSARTPQRARTESPARGAGSSSSERTASPEPGTPADQGAGGATVEAQRVRAASRATDAAVQVAATGARRARCHSTLPSR
jgi:type II secretory pathway predicted ATPase ExeA